MESLRETKIRISSEDHSKAFQHYAFSVGAKWISGSKEVKFTTSNFLYIDSFCCISRSDDEFYFKSHNSKEIFFPTCEQWNESGIPQAGTVCEYFHHESQEWKTCEVVAHHFGCVVAIDLLDGFAVNYSPCAFRPIKTPEQLAAEERENVLADMYGAVMGSAGIAGGLEALYDAGYRKVEVKK